MRIKVASTAEEMSLLAAEMVSETIRSHPDCVLGLATGETPILMYRELVRLHRMGALSFRGVRAFALDEYIGLGPDDPTSYHRYLHEQLFDHVDIDPANIHLIDGRARDPRAECARYSSEIERYPRRRLQVLGIGANGHIGFNEPGNEMVPHVHVVELDEKTIADNARFFAREDEVPRHAITLGIKDILNAERLMLLARGTGKADAIRRALRGEITPHVPASYLQNHPDLTVILDEAAAHLL